MEILAYIYYLITSAKNYLYDRNIIKPKEIPDVEIICVGNITVGGTGKTPGVQYFTKKLLDQGKKVAIVSRGYKGKRKREPYLVSDGIEIFATPKESGDEPYLHALNAKVPVVVGADRFKACTYVKRHFDVDAIILDDGFQHRKLKRNRDVVLVDATNPFGGRAMLPKGTLREDLKKGLERATEFIITKADLVSERELEKTRKYLSRYKKEVSIARHGVSSFCDLKGNMKPLFWVKDKRVLLFSGLANPLNFEKTVISLEPEYIERVDFLDHHNFKEKDFRNIEKRAKQMDADYIITTEKDLVKLPRNFKLDNTYVLKIKFTMLEDNTLKPVGG